MFISINKCFRIFGKFTRLQWTNATKRISIYLKLESILLYRYRSGEYRDEILQLQGIRYVLFNAQEYYNSQARTNWFFNHFNFPAGVFLFLFSSLSSSLSFSLLPFLSLSYNIGEVNFLTPSMSNRRRNTISTFIKYISP